MKKGWVGFVLLLSLAFILSGCSISAQGKYDSALELMEAGDYEEAVEIFAEIEDYEDSSDKISECRYELGKAAYESEDWDLAISYFEGLDYEDSEEMLETCTREKGMHENADYDFLEAIEESVLNRMEDSDSESSTYSDLVNTELAYLEEFENAEFYDENLKTIAQKYIEGLNIQKEALSANYEYEYQIEWIRGLVYREEALTELYEDYDFLSDNVDFVATYIYEYENNLALLTAYEAIEEDLSNQNSDDWEFYIYTDTSEVYFTFSNNTEYTYSTVFVMTFYDSDGVMLETQEDLIENITPGTTYEVSCYVENPEEISRLDWYNYYTEVIY